MRSRCYGRPGNRGRSNGFTLLELVVVVGIIGVLVGVAAPQISRYIRNYTIRGAANQLAAEIETARLQAIKKNVNFGAVFVVLTSQSYQYFLEDVQPAGVRATYATAQQGPIRSLPNGIFFQPAGAVDSGFRFNRLGAMCDPDNTTALLTCPDLSGSGITGTDGINYVDFDTTAPIAQQGAVVSLTQPDTGLTRTLIVSLGGRVQVVDR